MDSVCVCVYYVLCKCAAGCTISTTIICLHSAFEAAQKFFLNVDFIFKANNVASLNCNFSNYNISQCVVI